MLYCNRINVSESIHVHKESAPRGLLFVTISIFWTEASNNYL